MKRCMQYFCIGLVLSFQLTAHASVREIGNIPVNFGDIGNFKVMDDFAYITLGSSGLKFFSLSTPNEIGECSNQVVRCQLLGRNVNHIDVVGNYMYLTTDSGLEILEQISSSRAERIGALPISDARKIVVQNDLAYVIVGEKQVDIINIANRNSPKRISSYKSDEGGFDKIVVSGNYMYLTGASVKHYFIVDISNSLSPKQFPRFTVNEDISNLIVIGNYLYVIGSYVSIFDISVPSSPKKLILPNPLYFPSLSNIIVQDKYAYFIGSNELSIIDITNPKNPITKERYSFPNSLMYKVGVSGDYIYLADKTSLKQLKFNPVIIPCTYTVSDSNPIIAAAVDLDFLNPPEDYKDYWGYKLGKLSINTSTDENCGWTAKSSNNDWLGVATPNGIGSATIKYAIARNDERVERKAQLTITGKSNIAGQPDTIITIPVTQKAWGAFISLDKNWESITSQNYSVTYSISNPQEMNHYIDIFHLCGEINDTDFWVVLRLPESAQKRFNKGEWMYKPKANVPEFDFKEFAWEERDKVMQPIELLSTSFDYDYHVSDNKDKYCSALWRLLPPLKSNILPAGVYTFYAIATKKDWDDELTSRIHHNPITPLLNGDMSKIFSELAIFKLIITE